MQEIGAGGIGLEILEAALERELAVRRAELVRKRGHGTAVQVEAAVGIPAGGEKQERPASRSVRLVLGQQEVAASDGREHDKRCRQLVVGFAGKRLVQLAEQCSAQVRAETGTVS